MPGLTPRGHDYVDVVRAHRLRTTAYILADTGRCLGIQRDEVARVRGRKLRALTSRDLARLEPTGSWMLAVILCPGDGTMELAAWASRLPDRDLDRVSFYEHPDVEVGGAYRGWVAASLPMPLRDVVEDFASFHRVFGNDLNDRIYADATPGSPT